MALTQEVPRGTKDEVVPTPTRRWLRRRTVITIAAVVVLAVASGGLAWVRWDAEQTSNLRAAMADADAAFSTMLDAVADGQGVLSASDGRVSDESVRTRLADLVGGAAVTIAMPVDPEDLAITRRVEVPSAAPSLAPADEGRRAWTEELRRAAEAASRWTTEVVNATTAVAEAEAAWELEQAQAGYDAAVGQLGAAMDAGAVVLSSSEGKVADNAVRQSLADSIAAATTLRSAGPAAEVDALTAATAAMGSATAAVSTASQAVSDAQAAWQAEQDRIAAEQAAAAARAAAAAKRPTASSVKTSDSPSGTTGGGTASAPRVHSPSGSNFGTGTAPECTTPSCGITF